MKRRAGCIAQKWVTAALVLSGIVCFAIGASVAFAGEDSDLETSRKTVELDTITVTVQRQEENVQKVPVSVTVMGQTEIEDRKIESIGDLSDFVPNFMINNEGASGMNAPVMRGIYANATTLTVSSGLFVDGVPVLSSTGYEDTILDIERVEVLRGPQGTLYGKNTVSQELRLDSSSENIQWLVGLYYDT
jgi:iron complex outermembrane recepter protein